MDQLQTIYENSRFYLPVITFLIGIMGGLHCSTMCGAFVLTCSETKTQNAFYQLGRLFSYTVLMLLIFTLGSIVNLQSASKELTIITSILLGLAFIYLGVQGLVGLKLKVKFPAFIQNRTSKLWGLFLKKKEKTLLTSFGIGSLSILLPCGLLYSLILPLAAIDSFFLAILAIISFWIGTLPVMGFAPILVKKILNPLKKKAPIFLSLFFILFGMIMIGVRVQSIDFKASVENKLLICH